MHGSMHGSWERSHTRNQNLHMWKIRITYPGRRIGVIFSDSSRVCKGVLSGSVGQRYALEGTMWAAMRSSSNCLLLISCCMVKFLCTSHDVKAALVGTKTEMPGGCPIAISPVRPDQYKLDWKVVSL